jgi:hypothetical protein
MAAADYRLCDICSCKTFYDSNLDYDFREYPEHGLPRLGDWKVICEGCALTHEVVIKEKEE